MVSKLQLKDQDLIGKGYISEQTGVDMIIPSDMKEASWPFSWWNQFVRYVNENYKNSMSNDFRHTIFCRVTTATPYLQPRLESELVRVPDRK